MISVSGGKNSALRPVLRIGPDIGELYGSGAKVLPEDNVNGMTIYGCRSGTNGLSENFNLIRPDGSGGYVNSVIRTASTAQMTFPPFPWYIEPGMGFSPGGSGDYMFFYEGGGD